MVQKQVPTAAPNATKAAPKPAAKLEELDGNSTWGSWSLENLSFGSWFKNLGHKISNTAEKAWDGTKKFAG